MRTALALLTAVLLLAAPAEAQKLARKDTEVPTEGFKFRSLAGYDAVPPGGRDGAEVAKFVDGQNTVIAYAFATPKAGEEGEEGRSRAGGRRTKIETRLRRYSGFRGVEDSPTVDEEHEIDGFDARQRRWEWEVADGRGKPSPAFVEVWSFPMAHADVHLVYFGLEEFNPKWGRTIGKSGKSFEEIERTADDGIDGSSRTYEDQLKFAEKEAARTPGWRAIGTPSKRFVILTNAEKQAFIKEVIKRLEISRDVFEEDFPPPADFKAVSVVRICKDRQEFQRFSGAGGGVAGYFSPSSVELVLYDDVQTDRNATYAVVSHEAFHQYCHFLFGQSEAHRWFDEGQGDYYGGIKITGKKAKITPKMPAGLNRLSIIREMVRTKKYVPLEEHLNYSHREWQRHGVPSYAQSWSIVYMLRQGMEGKLRAKVWKKEYANIIPAYVSTLNKGFRDLYDQMREERRARAEEEGRELSEEELEVNRFMVDPRAKKKIWDAAMEASWGQVDLDEFEEHWTYYVSKMLK